MNAIVPLNIAALRVNNNDRTNVVSRFQGKTAAFENMPWYNPNAPDVPNEASTGDKIYNPLTESKGNPGISPEYPLGVGVHLHWELPDYFRKGTQPAQGGKLVFPAAPNRWLVTRYLSIYDPVKNTYGPISHQNWVIESDYLFPDLTKDKYGILRPAISVPVPTTPNFQQKPYLHMGRVVEYADWTPANESDQNYLPNYPGTDGNLYLTSIGFVGGYFGSYYPECCSVFGFWDNFADVPYENGNLYEALKNNTTIQFRVSYQVAGWLQEAGQDPLFDIDDQVTNAYHNYLENCKKNEVEPELNPTDFFKQITEDDFHWSFNLEDVSSTVNPTDNTIETLDFPSRSVCSGTVQEVVWNMGSETGSTYFLESNNDSNTAVWKAPVEIAVGNSTLEALSAMLKFDMGQSNDDPTTLSNYELLLDALQLGLLNEIEKNPNKLILLEEALHNSGFSGIHSGYQWVISQNQELAQGADPQSPDEITLPLNLAEQLHLLNQAQKNYDMGRDGLSIRRKQLFMDWTHYVKMYTGEINDPNISEDPVTANNIISDFLLGGSGGEITEVIDAGEKTGILYYTQDQTSGEIIGLETPDSKVSTSSLAYQVWTNYHLVLEALTDYPEWQMKAATAPSYYEPSEPVVLMEGDMIQPASRNGANKKIFVRLSPEILNQLTITSGTKKFPLTVSQLSGVPLISSNTPMAADIQALTGEAFLITPMLAPVVAAALATAGGTDNPAVANPGDFLITLMYGQGGLSPLDVLPSPGGIPAPEDGGLFARVGNAAYLPAKNPSVTVSSPQVLTITFTNAATNGWPPNTIGWNTQRALPSFSKERMDPFLPVFMIWNLKFDPLNPEAKDGNGNPIYAPGNLTDYFALDSDAVDYQYIMNGDTPVPFTTGDTVGYGNSATMSSKATTVLVYQINTYLKNYPNDPEKTTLEQIADLYASRNFLSQAISGFNQEQILTTYLAQVAVEDLTKGSRDGITRQLAAAATADDKDNWYDFAFNSLSPISTGLQAQGNFGPLRSGFMEIVNIELVDAFGQRMDLETAIRNSDGSLSCITSFSMTPDEKDSKHQEKIFLPPRLLTPTRLWFQWLSATHNDEVAGVDSDFVEMNTHPATSPVCGWILPNHLDNNLFFYDADGTPIGTFGIENIHTNPKLKYRTRAGNLNSSLTDDIGAPGDPKVNAHLANYMWYLNQESGQYLKDLMQVMRDSDIYIDPANFAQDASLSVLIGRPLALTRAVIKLETEGNLLPLNQADNDPGSPFPQDVINKRINYEERMQYSSANLSKVNFPLRLGDLANLDDGLIGFLIEGDGSNPYTGTSFYAPAAEASMNHGVIPPTPTTLALTLNAPVISLTMIIDPRAPVHATTGILPVGELAVPADQYSGILAQLKVNFITRPILEMANGLVIPLPEESGYNWSWIAPGKTGSPLKASAANEYPIYGYTPQSIQEGWVQLNPEPTEKNTSEDQE